MNLTKLFPVQKVLDERIMDKHPELKGQNNLDWKILALQVELGECANEWRGFKKWSHDQKPRTREILVQCDLCGEWTDYTHEVEGITVTKNYLLEEYVDCLHFILSIGLEIKFNRYHWIGNYQRPETITEMFLSLFDEIATFSNYVKGESMEFPWLAYSTVVEAFLELGEMLGFTWEQVEAAYMAKNEVNHERQLNDY
ncbi:dUTP diphosphatase [Bacillus badius]|uniref:dUTP diphosphatase n=1 Tax=Bacillus badius TaxID=1455 RepID=UPI001CC0C584|nr:dUTP diphosphatase [Bacillus badius]UAT29525.1 dUTP diphosphatase [Bacillus badius]